MKRLLMVALFLMLVAFAANAQITYPYVFTSALTCSPQSCSQFATLPPYWYGSVQTFATARCASGITPFVEPAMTDYYCSASTQIYSYVYMPGYSNLYVINGQYIYAQQLEGDSGILRLINGQYVQIGHAQQWSDCYTGALRQYTPPSGIC